MTEDKENAIQEASEELSKAIEVTVGKGTKVAVFYVYINEEEDCLCAGSAGNANYLELSGALLFLNNHSDKK